MKPDLVHVRLPTGWDITYHDLHAVPAVHFQPGDPYLEYLDEDLFQAVRGAQDLLLDVGWYPGGDPDGCYHVVMIRNENWEQPTFRAQTRDLDLVLATLECLAKVER